MTQVLDINELNKLIPETKKLDGKNFTDLKDLVSNVINAIEKTKEWEFVQYIQNKPSFFVIRNVQINTRINSKSILEIVQKETKSLKERIRMNQTDDIDKKFIEDEVKEDVKEEKIQALKPSSTAKLPWNKQEVT